MKTKQDVRKMVEELQVTPEVKERLMKRLDVYAEELTEPQLADFEAFLEEVATQEETFSGILSDYARELKNQEELEDLKMEQTLDAINAKAEALKTKAQSLAA